MLFPSRGLLPLASLGWLVHTSKAQMRCRQVSDLCAVGITFFHAQCIQAQSLGTAPRQVVVLDGGWRECACWRIFAGIKGYMA